MGTTAMPNPAQSGFPTILLPTAPDRRTQDRITTNLPIRIPGIGGDPVCDSAVGRNLGRGGIGFETTARIEAGKVIEFELEQMVDEPMRYWVRILFREYSHYGGYYVNDDGPDILPTN
jgi:hypothetical protein